MTETVLDEKQEQEIDPREQTLSEIAAEEEAINSDSAEEEVEEEVEKEEQEESSEDQEVDEKTKKEQEFLERRRKRAQKEREEREHYQESTREYSQEQEDDLQELRQAAQELKLQKSIARDRRVFQEMEKDFSENISDYTKTKEQAIEILKEQYIMNGMSEVEAMSQIEVDMLLKANKAYMSNLDPVEEVYKEAKKINDFIDHIASKRGYVKEPNFKPKTNMQALREASKPNAMTGGLGRGGRAVKTSFDEMDDLESIQQATLRDVRRG